jgi:hypothetical protein
MVADSLPSFVARHRQIPFTGIARPALAAGICNGHLAPGKLAGHDSGHFPFDYSNLFSVGAQA